MLQHGKLLSTGYKLISLGPNLTTELQRHRAKKKDHYQVEDGHLLLQDLGLELRDAELVQLGLRLGRVVGAGNLANVVVGETSLQGRISLKN